MFESFFTALAWVFGAVVGFFGAILTVVVIIIAIDILASLLFCWLTDDKDADEKEEE